METTTEAWIATTVASNTSYSMGPERTIMGVPIDVFSFIFLGIAGAAPVIFIITVVVSMKCYSWHKVRKLKRLQQASQAGLEMWEAERDYQINGKYQTYSGPALSTVQESPSSTCSDRLQASYSNPNVFFKDTSADTPEPKVMPPPSLDSEERQALECFDKIYENMDLSSGSEDLRTSFRYPHPLYDKTKNGLRLPLSHKISRKLSTRSSQVSGDTETYTLPKRKQPKRSASQPSQMLQHPSHSLAHTLRHVPLSPHDSLPINKPITQEIHQLSGYSSMPRVVKPSLQRAPSLPSPLPQSLPVQPSSQPNQSSQSKPSQLSSHALSSPNQSSYPSPQPSGSSSQPSQTFQPSQLSSIKSQPSFIQRQPSSIQSRPPSQPSTLPLEPSPPPYSPAPAPSAQPSPRQPFLSQQLSYTQHQQAALNGPITKHVNGRLSSSSIKTDSTEGFKNSAWTNVSSEVCVGETECGQSNTGSLDTDSIDQHFIPRQSWLHSTFTNLAYVPDS